MQHNHLIRTLDEVYKLLQDEKVKLDTKVQFVHESKTNNKIINMSLGRIWLNILLPSSFPLVNEVVDKDKLKKILYQIYEQYDVGEASTTINNLTRETFKMSSICPVSFNINELIVPQELKDKKKLEITEDIRPEDFVGKTEGLAKDFLDNLGSDAGISIISRSKATSKAKPIDIGVLFFAKGPVSDIEGNISKPITSGQNDGYNIEQYYAAAGEARKALYIRSVFTAEPGRLSRDIAYANANVVIGSNDCKTRKYFVIEIDKANRGAIIGRYFVNEKEQLELITNETDLIGKTIRLRSPLYCRDKTGICKMCYGKLQEKLGTKHIGLIASAAVNKLGIENFSMAIRHKSTQVNLKEVNFLTDLIKI